MCVDDLKDQKVYKINFVYFVVNDNGINIKFSKQ